MGIPIDVWRAIIWRFKQPSGHRQIEKIHPYRPDTKWSAALDITYRLVITTVLMIGTYTASMLVARHAKALNFDLPLFDLTARFETFDYKKTGLFIHRKLDYFDYIPATQHAFNPIYLAGDIELNPGPTDQEIMSDLKESILKRIDDLEKSVRQDVLSVKSEVTPLRGDVTELPRQVTEVKNMHDSVRFEIDEMHERSDRVDSKLDDLDARIEDQERRSRRNNLVMYNVPDTEGETYTQSKNKVLEILNSARETTDLPPFVARDIERSHRLPYKSTNKPRPIIVRMYHWEDKWHAVKLREVLKLKGYGIAKDLTNFQRNELYKLRTENPDSRFYYKGNKLIEVPKDGENDSFGADKHPQRVLKSISRPLRGQRGSRGSRGSGRDRGSY